MEAFLWEDASTSTEPSLARGMAGRRPSLPGPGRAIVTATLAALGASTGWPQALTGQALMPEPAAPTAEALEGRQVIFITGSTGGLGRSVALELGSAGAHIIVHGRNRERGLEVVEQIESSGEGTASFYQADLASLAEVRRLGEAILRDYDRVDVLVNNAGILAGDGSRRTSPDGHELSFAVNYLSGFLLTHMILPIIPDAPGSRIVNVSSGAQTAIDLDDPMMENGYSDRRSYAQSKLAQILFTFDLADQLADTRIQVNTLHPATLMDTNMVLSAGVRPRTSVEEGKEAVIHLITTPDIGNGQYFNGLRPARAHDQAYDLEARIRLRRLSEELTGL